MSLPCLCRWSGFAARFGSVTGEVVPRGRSGDGGAVLGSAETRVPATVGGALSENAMEWVDIATDQTGFPDGDEQNSALCVAGTDCGLGGRVHAAWMQVVVLSEN